MPEQNKPEHLPLPSAALGDEGYRRLLVQARICDAAHAAVTLELYGGLRIRTGCAQIPMHAATVREALAVLYRVLPGAERLLQSPDALSEHFRVSINGDQVTADLDRALHAGDRLILFSASVGG